MKLVTVAEMVSIERQANAGGLTYEAMMENAGKGLAQVVAEYCDALRSVSILGLVGSGNNGGDTLVALDDLAQRGWNAVAYIVRPRPADDPLMQRLNQAGCKIIFGDSDPELRALELAVGDCDVLLDGILGTGIQLPLRGFVAAVLAKVKALIRESEAPPVVVAVDCPSGVDSETGEAAQECIPAELTITMAAVKAGLLKFPAYNFVGKLEWVGIGLPPGLPAWSAIRRLVVERDDVRSVLPARPLDAHKGTFGTTLVIAGSESYTGAAYLAGSAAYRIGSGLVTLAVARPLHPALAGHLPEATWLLLPHEGGFISESAVELVRDSLERVTAVLIGPGLGMQPTTRGFLSQLLQFKPGQAVSLVMDADGLKLLAQLENWPKQLPGVAVLTPHPGEMSVLTGLDTSEIQADRVGVAERFSREWGHVVVLKGAFTVISAPDGRTAVIPVASPALARAGTGDVLAGLIAGLRSQRLEAFEAAWAGSWIHAQAGLHAAAVLGSAAAVLAGDVLQGVVDVTAGL